MRANHRYESILFQVTKRYKPIINLPNYKTPENSTKIYEYANYHFQLPVAPWKRRDLNDQVTNTNETAARPAKIK